MENVGQLGLGSLASDGEDLGHTAYRMTSFSTERAPWAGHVAGGLGSTNSAASVGISLYSLIRSMATILCSSCTNRRTTKRRSCELVFAKARAKPAIAAVTPGANRQMRAVTPMTTEESRLNRADHKPGLTRIH